MSIETQRSNSYLESISNNNPKRSHSYLASVGQKEIVSKKNKELDAKITRCIAAVCLVAVAALAITGAIYLSGHGSGSTSKLDGGMMVGAAGILLISLPAAWGGGLK